MLSSLKFVQGAVSKKEFTPALTHYKIENGNVRSYNGTLSISCPIQIDVNCTPNAKQFFNAISKCNETLSLSVTKNNRLSVKSGKFKAFIDCLTTPVPEIYPEGDYFDIDGEQLLKAFKICYPFIGENESVPWSTGLLFSKGSAFATNNFSLIQYWIGKFPVVCNIPKMCVKEILRIKEPPIQIQACERSVTFHYKDGGWLRSQLLATQWPDVTKMLDSKAQPVEINEEFWEALSYLEPFCDDLGRVYFDKNLLRTGFVVNEGASYEIDNFEHVGIYQIKLLKLLQNVANKIDFSLYPKPALFYGERIRGAIIGRKE